MKETIIAKRYARALIALAKENKAIDDISKGLQVFALNLEESKDLKHALTYADYDLKHRLNVLNDLSQKLNLHKILIRFLELLIKKERLEIIVEINEEFMRLANKEKNRLELIVTSATKLPDKQYQDLQTHFIKKTGKDIVLKKEIDKTVLGGIQVQLGDQVYDYTLKKQLEDIKERMIN